MPSSRKIKIRLIPNWRKSWHFFSMQSMGLATAVQGAWLSLPDDLKASIPGSWVACLTIVILVAGFFGRLVIQDKAKE